MALTPLNDSTAETAESVILSLRSDEDYRLGSSRAATVNIENNSIDLDIIEGNAAQALSEEDEDDPGAYISQTIAAALIAEPVGMIGLTRRITWDNADKVLVKDSSQNIVSSGIELLESDGVKLYQVSATANFEVNDSVKFTMEVLKNGVVVGKDEVQVHTRTVTVKWVAKNSKLDNDTIFPDKTSPTDTTARDEVYVEATIHGDIPPDGTLIYFRSYDVDDPSSDPILDPNDDVNGTSKGFDNRGNPAFGVFTENTFPAGAFMPIVNGKARATFLVTHQPGDNFRIAAALNLADMDMLSHDNVPPSNASVEGFSGGLTDMLTVWRRLWIEVDSMTSVTGNTTTQSITKVVVTGGPVDQIEIEGIPIWNDHQLEGGTLTTTAPNRVIPIYDNTQVIFAGPEGEYSIMTVSVPAGHFTPAEAAAVSQTASISAVVHDDDDDTLLPSYPDGGAIMKAAYADAYILSVDAGQYNLNTTIPFHKNLYEGPLRFEMNNSQDLTNAPPVLGIFNHWRLSTRQWR